ncbi:MAG: hypothetical protein KUG53_04135 [Pseudomonadales bacterium]|nr:hypothetical protein [Pseudomonadales bacterium]
MNKDRRPLIQRLLLRLYFLLQRIPKSNLAEETQPDRGQQIRTVQPYLKQGADRLQSSAPIESILFFAPTIGELRASAQLIKQIKQQHPNYELVLMPGKEQYLSQYAELYPDTIVLSPDCNDYSVVNGLFDRLGVRQMLMVEGPSLMGRFPTWLSLAFPVVCLLKAVNISVVNACIYQPEHQNIMARLRTRIFAPLHKQAINCWYTADQKFVDDLTAAGVPQPRIKVVGDIKFDSILLHELEPVTQEFEQFLLEVGQSEGPLVVAGSVTAADEIEAIIEGWLQLKQQHTNTRLVLAPRYIHEEKLISTVIQAIQNKGLKYVFRTDGSGSINQADVIILNTYGELPHLYRDADIVFAGRDHGVLEPLRFNKPVVVGPDQYWNREYATSYSLYEYMKNSDALVSCDSYDQLGAQLLRLLDDTAYKKQILSNAAIALANQTGASQQIVECLEL